MAAKRFLVFFLAIIMLAACGISDDQAAAPTEPPASTEDSTAIPSPVSAAEEAAPTGALGAVSDTTIPAPPDGTVAVAGENMLVDTLTSAMGPALEPVAAEQNMTISTPTTYVTTAPYNDIVEFYTTAMAERGWSLETNEDQQGNAVLGFVAGDDGAMIVIMDGASLGTDNVVMTINMSR